MINKLKNYLDVFVFSIIFGFITHGFMILNKLPNSDDIVNLVSENDMLKSGRWFLKYASSISGDISIPWVIGTISIVVISIVACIIIDILDITDIRYKVLLIMFMQTFEAVGATFIYMFTADAYLFSMLLAVMGVLCVKNNRYIIGIMCMTFSLGIYQAYIAFSMGLFALLIFKYCMDNSKSVKEIIKDGLSYIMSVGTSLILYYVILKFLLYINDVTLLEYQGIGDVDPISLILSIVYRAQRAVIGFVKYFIVTQIRREEYLLMGLHVGAIALAGYQFVYVIIKDKVYKQISRFSITILSVGMMPICFAGIYLFTDNSTHIHSLMIYSMVLLFIAIILVLQKYDNKKYYSKVSGKLIWSSIIILVLTVYQQYLFTNQTYFLQHLNYESTYAHATSIMSRMSNKDGFNEKMPIYIVGTIDKNRLYTQEEFEVIYENTIISKFATIHEYSIHHFIEKYIGFEINTATVEQQQQVLNSQEFKTMGNYPNSNSIEVIKGVLVVKLGD